MNKNIFAFLFVIFCGIHAQSLPDFEIYLNNVNLGASSPIDVEVTYGDNDVFSVRMPGNAQNDYEWCWNMTSMPPAACLSKTYFWFPDSTIDKNQSANLNWEIIIKRIADSETKQINLTIKPKPYIVTFNTDGGMPVPPPQSVLKEANASRPAAPSKTGYDFDNWYGANQSSPFDFATPITEDITLTAKWIPVRYKITWLSEGATVKTDSVPFNTMPTAPPSPTKASSLQYSYQFKSWLPALALVTGDQTYTAQFDSTLREYQITLNPQGGTVSPATIKTKYDVAIGTIPEPSRTGYTFNGWFTAATGGTQYTAATIYADVSLTTLYAQWTPIDYTITYNSNGFGDFPDTIYNITSSPITLPVMEHRSGYVFDGWFADAEFSGTALTVFAPSASNLGNKTFYAKWTERLLIPTVDMLDYSLPTNLIYNAQPITPVSVTPKSGIEGTLGNITKILYNNSIELPKNSDTYKVSVFIEKSPDYDSATLFLGEFTIRRANVNIELLSFSVDDKLYDGTTSAIVHDIDFTGFYDGDTPVEYIDYSVVANFASANVGVGVSVSGEVQWKQSSDLAKNYILQNVGFNSTANITKVASVLKIAPPENYEIYNKTRPTFIQKSDFINANDIIWEYRKIPDGVYTTVLPDKIGDWIVRATIAETVNYTGAVDSAEFSVVRGHSLVVQTFIPSGNVYADNELSDLNKKYFVVPPSDCNLKNTEVSIQIKEQDIVLKINGVPQPGTDIDDYTEYKIPINLNGSKVYYPLVYELISKDNTHSESDTLLVETPISFDSVGGQKWNNLLYINNNPKTNGGYEWANFKWFKNDSLISNKQFYSAGQSARDTLKTSDLYYATMYSTDGSRVSTCEISPKSSQASKVDNTARTKVVLEKKAVNRNENVYNAKGERVIVTPPGVYLVK